jgi:hypothetical protein
MRVEGEVMKGDEATRGEDNEEDTFKCNILLFFRHSFWIKATKGDELSKFFCSDNKDDMLKLIAAVVQAKVSFCRTSWMSCDSHMIYCSFRAVSRPQYFLKVLP